MKAMMYANTEVKYLISRRHDNLKDYTETKTAIIVKQYNQ